MPRAVPAGVSAAALAVAACLVSGARAGQPVADLVLYNGKIHTQDSGRSVVDSLAIRGDAVVASGSRLDVAGLIGRSTRRIDLRGRTVLPGIIDAHTHPAMSALDDGKCSLEDKTPTLARLASTVAKCLAERPVATGAWIQVIMVNPVGADLTLAQLDRVFGARPAFLMSSDAHTGWVDSAGLAAAGISAATPDPPGGHLMRGADGEPNGTLHDTATDLVQNVIPAAPIAVEAARCERALTAMYADGITSVQDASADDHLMSVYRYLYVHGRLHMRVRGSMHLKNLAAAPGEVVAHARAFATRWSIDPHRLRADAVKIFADGGIEYPSHTATLLAPYLDAGGRPTADRGPRYFEQSALNDIVAELDAADFTIHVHSIGDAATRAVLDAFAYARQRNGMRDNRDQIAHLELVDPQDLPRFRELGVIANMQMLWAQRDAYTVGATMPYIGEQRARYLYPARSLRDAGAVIAGGSDWSVSTFDPFTAMEHAITRAHSAGAPPLYIEESVTLQDMVDAYTINAAFALKQDLWSGSLIPGKRADFIVLDRDIFTIPAATLHRTVVLATFIDGSRVYGRGPWARARPTQ